MTRFAVIRHALSFSRLREKVDRAARRMRDGRYKGEIAPLGEVPHPTRLRRATFSRKREKEKTALSLGSILLLLAASPACAQAVKIGVAAPLSGADAIYGNAVKLGVEQAITDLGPAFAGRRAVAVPRDDGNDPKKGVVVAKAFVADNIRIVIGDVASAVTVPASAVYAEAGALVITPSAQAPLVTDRGFSTLFRTCGRADAEAGMAARYVAAHRGARVALVHDRSGPGKDFADAVRRQMSEAGVRDVYYGSFERGAHDVGGLVGRLKLANAQYVVFGGSAADAGQLTRQLRDAGARAIVLGGLAMASDEFASVAGPAADGALAVFPQDPRARPAAADLLRRLQAKGIEPDFPVFYAYAAVQVIAQASNAAGTLEAAKLAATMHEPRSFETVLGPLAFDAKGDPRDADLAIYVWHRGASGRMAIDQLAPS